MAGGGFWNRLLGRTTADRQAPDTETAASTQPDVFQPSRDAALDHFEIGAEIGRALNWQTKGNKKLSWNALERGLELFDLTVSDTRWKYRLKEILRAREVVCDYFAGDNEYKSTPASLEKYFLQYALAARKDK